jgi:hypothetical protein
MVRLFTEGILAEDELIVIAIAAIKRKDECWGIASEIAMSTQRRSNQWFLDASVNSSAQSKAILICTATGLPSFSAGSNFIALMAAAVFVFSKR